jgi:hypothetical protein
MPHIRSNAGLYLGLGCLGVAVGPIAVFAFRQWAFGLFPGDNGLGLGLWLVASGPFALVVLILGVFRDDRTQRSLAATAPTPTNSPHSNDAPPHPPSE